MKTHLWILLVCLSGTACAQDAPAPAARPEAEPREAPAKTPKKKKREVVPGERRRPTDLEALRAAAFEPELLAARRKQLLDGLPADAIVVLVAPGRASEIRGYRQDPDFLYLSGQSEPGLTILMGPGLDTIFVPPRDKRFERWNGTRLAMGTPQAEASGFQEVALRGTRRKVLREALAKHPKATLFLHGSDLKKLGLDPKTKTRSPSSAIAALRQVKAPAEIALLQRAADVTCASLTEAIRSIQPGQYEYEVQAVIEYVFARYGAQRPGFTSIVGAGPNSCVLHYSANRRRFGKGELIVMDVGAEVFGYTADVTRTVPTSGTFSPRQREIYETVLAAQLAGIKAVRPGATLGEIDEAARAVVRKKGLSRYFLHSTSHWLGLDVHDVGARGRPLEAGMVLTVEPGIYIAAESLGVRIEDDVLVTKTGALVLSAGVPKTVKALEALMAQRGVGKVKVTPLPAPQKPKISKSRPRHFKLKTTPR